MISLQCDYVELVNVALRVEKSLGEKRISLELSEEKDEETISVKKLRTTMSQGSRWSSDQKQKCNECSKRHTGTCIRKSITCYQCGKKWHYKSECQNKFTEHYKKSKLYRRRNSCWEKGCYKKILFATP